MTAEHDYSDMPDELREELIACEHAVQMHDVCNKWAKKEEADGQYVIHKADRNQVWRSVFDGLPASGKRGDCDGPNDKKVEA